MVQDTDPALKQLTGVAITVLAASSHLWEETHDLVWKGWTYFFARDQSALQSKTLCLQTAALPRHFEKGVRTNLVKVQETPKIFLLENTPKRWELIFLSYVIHFSVAKYGFALYEETYKWGGKSFQKARKISGGKEIFFHREKIPG